MSRNRFKQITALILAFSMLLCINGDCYRVFASSVSTDTSSEEIEASNQEEKVDDSTSNQKQLQLSDPDMDQSNDIKSDNEQDNQDNNTENKTDTSKIKSQTSLLNNETESSEVLEGEKDESSESGTELPLKEDGSVGDIHTGVLYIISSYEQWIALSKYSKNNDLEGYRFHYSARNENGQISYEYDLASQEEFQGLGSENHPFAGELSSNFTVDNITLKLNKPLFTYLSSKAKIDKNKILLASSSCAGLAEHLVVTEDATLNYENITVLGTIGSSTMTGKVGGLFANVTVSAGKTLTIQGNNVSVSASVTGETAGGLIGELKGSAAIHLGGIDFSAAEVQGITTNISNNDNKCGRGCVGGIIGSVVGNSSTESTLKITNSNDEEFVYNRTYECSGDSEYCGGFFGRIQNTTVDVSCPMTYIGDENLQIVGIKGFNVGAFAGEIDNSNVVLHRQVICKDVKLGRPSYANVSGFDWKDHGVGLFVGTLRESKISVASDFTSDAPADAIVVKTSKSFNSYDDYAYRIYINDKETWIANFTNLNIKEPNDQQYLEATYNVGFLLGLCYDSEVQFTSDHKCKIYSNKLDFTFGYAGGVIGRMVAKNKESSLKYVEIPTNNQINLMNRSDYSGGLVGQAYVAGNNDILISNCDFKGYFRYTDTTYVRDQIPSAVGVVAGGVSEAEHASGRFVLDNVKTSFIIQYSSDKTRIDSFGGVIGEMNANFVIRNSSFQSTKEINYGGKTKYVGGLIGVVGKNNGDNRIHGEVIGSAPTDSTDSSMLISMPFTSGKVSDAFGGLFGYVGKNTAISLSGNISQDGQKINLNNYKNPANAGSIVGYQDDALIFMEPDTKLTKSTNYEFDEIGNYGGVFRNDDYDNDTHKLIENFKITGTLKNELANKEDLLRLAVALKTEGYFLPDVQLEEENQTSFTAIEQINSASYTLTGTEYDLTDTGISCLNRNDETGINTPFKGSLKGQTTATIKFGNKEADKDKANIHNQPYLGLFSAIDGGTAGSDFENLDLQFRFKYNSQVFNNNSKKVPKKENFGGLAAVSKGNISLKNITYNACVTDSSNTEYSSKNEVFSQYNQTETIDEENYDCIGGLLGRYIGAYDSTLTIGKINTNGLQLTCSDYTHVVGGIIGYVDLSVLQKGQACKILLGTATEADSVSLSGNIIVTNSQNTNGKTFPIRTGGLIARIGNATRSELYDPKCHLSISNLKMDGFTLNETVSLTSDSEIGGLWGWKWTDVDVSLQGGSIGASQNTGLSVNASFGGLVHTVSGKMKLQNLTIGENTSMDAQKSNVEKCGLLVQDGQYLYLDVQDYTISKHDSILTQYKNTDFDELVGITKGGDDSGHGGIVSIGKVASDKYYLGRNGQAYESFASSHITNPNTRYYYDLNKLSWSDGASSYTSLNNADDIMRWHLLHYVNSYLLSALDSQYSAENGLLKEYTIGGTDESPIDLTGFSLYPTPVNGEIYTEGVIKLNAKSIITGESNISDEKGKYPDKPDSQHYQMQAGLFANVTGLSVSNLKMTGSYSQSDSFAGALVAGTISGVPQTDAGGNIVTDASGKTQYDDKVTNAFKNIEINNLWCVSSNSTFNYDAPIGLLIADISSGAQVSFDTITMTDYLDTDVTDGKKAASALIGNVGGETATYISMSFMNMDIADAAQTMDSVSTAKDQALAKASFIYRYEYADNCNGIYTFTYDDYIHGRCVNSNTKYVTLGNELGDGGGDTHYAIEEYFDIDYPVGQLQAANSNITFKFSCSNYIPYVCNGTKKILVNPKTGHLDKGCGTYEDPYIISSARQLLSLYRYLYEEDKFQSIFVNGKWKVNPVGSDNKLCDGSEKEDTGHGKARIYQKASNESFPKKEQLSSAYYLISKDIDLSDYPEFTGFGTTDLPFTGVFVGDYSKSDTSEETQDSTYPKITMPKIPKENAMADFGFVKFSKGCVVRNIVIHFPQSVSINQETTVTTEEGEETKINRGGVGGGVIATVLGGENIIEGVQVTGTCFKPMNAEAEIGGYVGRVNAGGLILRNMQSDVLENFKIEESEGTDYLYTCGIIGRVLDGYVVYDGDTYTVNPLYSFSGSTGTSTLTGTDGNPLKLEPSRSYDILNGSYLKAEPNKISWNSTSGFDNISNGRQLQVLSMALNAGLLNYNADDHYLYDGYNDESRQRSGDYSYVGSVETSNQTSASYNAWKQVAKYDNNNNLTEGTEYHSYLSDFFDWSNMLTNGQSAELNPYDKATSFILTGTGSADYDMTRYKTAFRGLGGRYFDQNYQADGKIKANVFHGNLTGPESSAKIQLHMLVDGSQNAEYAALLNNIVKPNSDSWNVTISNITVSGDVINTSKLISDTDTDNIKVSTISDSTKNAAALISDLSNVKLTLENILLDSINVQSEHYAGGMIALCDGSTGSVLFDTCGITGSETSVSSVKGCTDTGGFIGYSTIGVTISPISKLEHMDIECIADSSSEERKNAGGLIGTIDRDFTISGSVSDDANTIPDPLDGNHIIVKTTGDKENVQIGGLVGRTTGTKQTYAISNMTLMNLTVENSFNGTYATQRNDETKWIIATGGIIGAAAGNGTIKNVTVGSRENTDSVSIQNTSDAIPNHDFYGTGGMVGHHISGTTMTMTNCQVLGAIKDDNTYSTEIKGCGKYVGGMIGNSVTFTGDNLLIEGVSIDAGRYAGGVIGWVQSKNVLSDVNVKNVSIQLNGEYENNNCGDLGGVIGYSGGTISLTNISVDSITIASDYCNNAGGYIGRMAGSNYVSIKTDNKKENSVKNSFISGQNAGGIFGKVIFDNNCCNITVSNNKIISCKEKGSYSSGTAGGFAGCLDTNTCTALFVNQLTIDKNLISAYSTGNDKYAVLGGVSGYAKSRFVFCDITLSDNAIGMMKVNTDTTGDELPQELSERSTSLASSSVNDLKEYLYFMTNSGSIQFPESKIKDTSVEEENFYKYCYRQGAFIGKADSVTQDKITKFINVRVTYQDPTYRPVADVGAENKLASNDEMYDTYRSNCVIIYDGKAREKQDTPSIQNSLLTDSTDVPDLTDDVPYVFNNLQSIMEEYTGSDTDRRAYRLGDNYQNCEAINRGTDSEPDKNKNKSVEQVYQNTFYDQGYTSPYVRSDGTTAIPMVVYKSSQNGTLDEVIQTYINIFTNNSGGLNSYVNTFVKSDQERILSVNAIAMQVKNGVVSQNTSAKSSIQVEKVTDTINSNNNISNSIYKFDAPDGDDYTDSKNGNFTLIRIIYGWKDSSTTVSWTLDIPIYVQKRLKVTSNMKMLEGICYNTDKLKKDGKNVLKESEQKSPMVLSKGSSYSIYAEYVYENSESSSSVKIPKSLYIDTDAMIYFTTGTKLTLIPLDEGARAYYYEVPESAATEKPKEIEFTKFKNADNIAFETQDITKIETKNDYEDLCKTKHEGNSKVERFVLLVDTSNAAGISDSGDTSGSSTGSNRGYNINVKPSSVFMEDTALYSRTEYTDHCYGMVLEINGATYKINTSRNADNTNNNTYLKASSSIREDGKVGVHLQYDVKANTTYWGTVETTEPKYLDIGFSLAYKADTNGSLVKIPLPSGTTITLGTGDDKVSLPVTGKQSTTYYYQSLRQTGKTGENSYVKINDHKADFSSQIDCSFDFSGADLSELDVYSGGKFYVVAQLVVMGDMNLPAAGDVMDKWEESLEAELKSDFGFALNVKDLTTLGMNQYLPEKSDSGVVAYTASIAFPENNQDKLDSKYYTIIYQIEEKTSSNTGGKPDYQPYIGENVSLLLGEFNDSNAAKSAVENETSSESSGKGIVAATYQFSSQQISEGAELTDGKTASGSDKIAKVIKTHCTLVANCSGLDMTNYRVKAYLLVTDSLPTLTTSGNASSTESENGCLKHYWLRDGNWPTISSDVLTSDLKSDYFVFMVAKIKTSM